MKLDLGLGTGKHGVRDGGTHSSLGWEALHPGFPFQKTAGSDLHCSPRKALSSCQDAPASPVQFHLSLQELEKHDSQTAKWRWVTAMLWQCWGRRRLNRWDWKRGIRWYLNHLFFHLSYSLHRISFIKSPESVWWADRNVWLEIKWENPLCAFLSASFKQESSSSFAFYFTYVVFAGGKGDRKSEIKSIHVQNVQYYLSFIWAAGSVTRWGLRHPRLLKLPFHWSKLKHWYPSLHSSCRQWHVRIYSQICFSKNICFFFFHASLSQALWKAVCI